MARRWGKARGARLGPPIRSRADAVEGGHRVSGEWMMSSGSRHATWIGLMAPVFDPSDATIPLPEGTSTRIFFVPADAVEWIDSWNVSVSTPRTASKSTICSCPGYSRPGSSPRRATPRPALQVSPQWTVSVSFSAVALGIARAMLDACVALAEKPSPRYLCATATWCSSDRRGRARLRSARGFIETGAARLWAASSASMPAT